MKSVIAQGSRGGATPPLPPFYTLEGGVDLIWMGCKLPDFLKLFIVYFPQIFFCPFLNMEVFFSWSKITILIFFRENNENEFFDLIFPWSKPMESILGNNVVSDLDFAWVFLLCDFKLFYMCDLKFFLKMISGYR